MSIRHGLLALLESGPRYGYQLRAAFEESTGTVWPLNIGQVYTTLARLERDGLVAALPEADGGARPYQLTTAGREELATWFATPVARVDRPRDELAIKLGLALTTDGADPREVIRIQRTATMRALQEYTRLKKGPAADPADLPWQLVLDKMIFQAEAEMRWLDHCEAKLSRYAVTPPAAPASGAEPSGAEQSGAAPPGVESAAAGGDDPVEVDR